ncbi:hypothetical protein V8C42DRAFT_82869 [Trichoderma barbatum]
MSWNSSYRPNRPNRPHEPAPNASDQNPTGAPDLPRDATSCIAQYQDPAPVYPQTVGHRDLEYRPMMDLCNIGMGCSGTLGPCPLDFTPVDPHAVQQTRINDPTLDGYAAPIDGSLMARCNWEMGLPGDFDPLVNQYIVQPTHADYTDAIPAAASTSGMSKPSTVPYHWEMTFPGALGPHQQPASVNQHATQINNSAFSNTPGKGSLTVPYNREMEPSGALDPYDQATLVIQRVEQPTQMNNPDGIAGVAGASGSSILPPNRDGTQRRLACPLSKFIQAGKPLCQSSPFENFSREKEHVRNKHPIPVYCPRCYSTKFKKQHILTAHLRSDSPCGLQPPRKMHGYDPSKKEHRDIIGQRVNPNKTEEERWIELFEALFPDQGLPASIYAE